MDSRQRILRNAVYHCIIAYNRGETTVTFTNERGEIVTVTVERNDGLLGIAHEAIMRYFLINRVPSGAKWWRKDGAGYSVLKPEGQGHADVVMPSGTKVEIKGGNSECPADGIHADMADIVIWAPVLSEAVLQRELGGHFDHLYVMSREKFNQALLNGKNKSALQHRPNEKRGLMNKWGIQRTSLISNLEDIGGTEMTIWDIE